MHKMEYFSIFLPNNIIKIVSPAAKDDEPDQETDILWAKRSIVVDDQAAWLLDVQFERKICFESWIFPTRAAAVCTRVRKKADKTILLG